MQCNRQAYAGNKLDLRFYFPDYPATAGWVGTVALISGSQRYQIALSSDGDALVGSALPATTATWAPGLYDIFVLVSNGQDRQTAHTDQLSILPDPGATEAQPSALEADLAKVDAAISAILDGKGVQSYTIQTQAGSRQIQRMSLDDLRKHRSWLLGQIDAERAAMGLKRRNRRWKTIRTRFSQ